jgi:toxin ParE1/3/4
MSHYRLDKDARQDLQNIWDHIAQDSPGAADQFLGRVLKTLRLLAGNSQMGQARPELGDRLRSFTVGAYVVFFRPFEQGIEVARIVHGARDLDVLF